MICDGTSLMGKYLDIIRAAERQKTQRGTFVVSGVSVVIENAFSSDQNHPQRVNWLYDQNDGNDKSRVAPSFPYADELDRLDRRCPDHIDVERWRQCIADASRFICLMGR